MEQKTNHDPHRTPYTKINLSVHTTCTNTHTHTHKVTLRGDDCADELDCGMKNRHTDQWDRWENPEINPHMDGQLIHTKGAKKMKREGQSLQLMVSGKLDSHMQ